MWNDLRISGGQHPHYITRSVEREARKAVSQDLSSEELSNEEETDTLGTDSGTLQSNLPRGGNREMAAEATSVDSMAALLQYLIEKDVQGRKREVSQTD